ncbi:hypothetical protein [Klenkia brasiliensis]|uniref:Uncharacterized protein n=1 Tax=Klenkia brasiliensis TaxID=333142 RepID=A0A1G7MD49_9ACTN|nr:hypothetical protein [Klenkia brasiliensis]SDF59712.1 hypothetical protein SAMN05660324_0589 [Klenkia brasiliensis]
MTAALSPADGPDLDQPALRLVPPRRTLTLLEAARMCPVTTKVLWVEYLTLGGAQRYEEFCGHLADPADGDPTEHGLVVQTLAEVLADEGVDVDIA